MIIQNSVFVNDKMMTKNHPGRKTVETYDKIKELCSGAGISMTGLSQALGIGTSTFCELKKGRTKQLSVSTLNKIADYFGVPVSMLLTDGDGGTEEMKEELFEKRKLLFDLSAKASVEELNNIIKIVDALVGSAD